MPDLVCVWRICPAALGRAALLACFTACVVPEAEREATAETDESLSLPTAPPLGWNSWNTFGCAIDEARIRGQAQAMVRTGMQAAGYQYVNIDDCWMAKDRDKNGNLQADPERFPHGMRALSDAIHTLGLKVGIYSSPGPYTCVGRGLEGLYQTRHPGSADHEEQDAATFASWGVDYLKYDRCTATKDEAESRFSRMGQALVRAGRPIVYSINPDGATSRVPWSTYANLWRTSPDVNPSWTYSLWSDGWWASSIVDIINLNEPRAAEAGPGRWNDPDMLEVGVEKPFLFGTLALSSEEGRSQFSMWAMMAAPLLAGNDLEEMSPETRETLTNTEVIAIDQDPLVRQATRVRTDDRREVWVKPLANHGFAVALFNRRDEAAEITVQWADVGLADTASATVRDLWARHEIGRIVGKYGQVVPAHGTCILTLSAPSRANPALK